MPDRPEKIDLATVTYDDASGSFQLGYTAQFGIATAADAAGFEISSTIEVQRDGATLATVTASLPVEKAGDGRDGVVPLVPHAIAFDRGSLSGLFRVVTSARLQKFGNDVADGSDSLTVDDVLIGDPNR